MASNTSGYFQFIGQPDWLFPRLETGKVYYLHLIHQGDGTYIADITDDCGKATCPYRNYEAFRKNWSPISQNTVSQESQMSQKIDTLVDTRLFIDELSHVINAKVSWAYNVIPADSFFYMGYRQALREIEQYLAKAVGK